MAKWIIEFEDEPDPNVAFSFHKVSVTRQITPEEENNPNIIEFKPFARKYWWSDKNSLSREIKKVIDNILTSTKT